MLWDLLLEIFRIYEQFAAGDLNQSGGTCTKYILAYADRKAVTEKYSNT
jgi:hypothetical protein